MFEGHPTIGIICEVFMKTIYKNYLINVIFGLGVSSFILPYVQMRINKNIANYETKDIAIFYIMVGISINMISSLHTKFIMSKNNIKLGALIESEIEEIINFRVMQVEWDKMRKLHNGDFVRTKDRAKWGIQNFVHNLVNNVINLLPFFGYSLYLMYVSFFSFIFYIFGVILYFIISKNKKDKKIRTDKIWDRYWYLSNSIFYNTIHNNGKKTLKEMKECLIKCEEMRTTRQEEHNKKSETMNIIISLIYIMNCYLFLSKLQNTYDIMNYVFYTELVRSRFTFLLEVGKGYKNCDDDYKKFLEKINVYTVRKEPKTYISNFDSITIRKLKYIYQKKEDETPFELNINNIINFRRGELILVSGARGNGKSTFLDILSAVISYTNYESEIFIDDVKSKYGFDSLINIRNYTEQSDQIDYNPCIYEIISGQSPEYNIIEEMDEEEGNKELNVNVEVENMVWEAIRIVNCDDFVTRTKEEGKKDIYTRDCGMSGGQKGQIGIARSIYKILKEKPKIVIFDEIDKSINEDLLMTMMTSIYDYCRRNNILTFIVAHSSIVKKMEYDQIITFQNGKII